MVGFEEVEPAGISTWYLSVPGRYLSTHSLTEPTALLLSPEPQ